MSSWPLSDELVRLLWLRALCGVAEGASTASPAFVSGPAQCVASVLGDAQKRLCVLGGRGGMPRSLGSVLGSFVTRFLGGFRGEKYRCIAIPGVKDCSNGVFVSRDGSLLFVAGDYYAGSAIHVYSVATGRYIRNIGGFGNGPLEFNSPRQVCVSPDDFIFIADYGNDRIQVLTPRFKFFSFVGIGQLFRPSGVCANKDVIVVSQLIHEISVFNRADGGTLLRRFGFFGSGDGQLQWPSGMCFVGAEHHIAVADYGNDRISMFRIDGSFLRHVGAGKLLLPRGVSSSKTWGELVVTDSQSVALFSACGELLHSFGRTKRSPTAIAIHHGSIFALNSNDRQCFIYM